ncbi:DUF4142 domain-containing protein [Sphingomonas aracearum]|uniref:DUF4142 domain-containing protein n=2 Tax=Sphingomonas aracearum TaxID=2283317 RepID=A0A369VVM9_9SPHN|nr:DUF4142 domain-containing protein [Sphingomonas aracearum]
MTPATYVKMAGASDQYEIQSSKLVLATTRNAKLRDFANQMVTDHTKSTADVTAAAKADGLTPMPPMPDADGLKKLAALRAAKGAARDTLYVQQQKMAHQKALKLHTDYSSAGTATNLKSVAAQIVPVVQMHYDMVSAM